MNGKLGEPNEFKSFEPKYIELVTLALYSCAADDNFNRECPRY